MPTTRCLQVELHCVHVILAPAAETVKYGPLCLFQGLCHFVETVERDQGRAHAPHMVAVVVLQVIYPPRGEALSILLLVVKRPSCTYALLSGWSGLESSREDWELTVSRTRHFASTRIHAEEEASIVQLIGHGSHATGEFGLVRDEVPIFAAATGPAVVEYNVLISQVLQAEIGQKLRGFEQ